MDLELRPWQWLLIVCWAMVVGWRLAMARAAMAPTVHIHVWDGED